MPEPTPVTNTSARRASVAVPAALAANGTNAPCSSTVRAAQHQRIDARQHAVDVGVAVARAGAALADLAQHRAGVADDLARGRALERAGAGTFVERIGVRVVMRPRSRVATRAGGRASPARGGCARRWRGGSRRRSPARSESAPARRRPWRRTARAARDPRSGCTSIGGHVADGRNQVVVQVVGAAGVVLLHQRQAEALRDAAVRPGLRPGSG